MCQKETLVKGFCYICVVSEAWLQTVPTAQGGCVGLCGWVTLGAACTLAVVEFL